MARCGTEVPDQHLHVRERPSVLHLGLGRRHAAPARALRRHRGGGRRPAGRGLHAARHGGDGRKPGASLYTRKRLSRPKALYHRGDGRKPGAALCTCKRRDFKRATGETLVPLCTRGRVYLSYRTQGESLVLLIHAEASLSLSLPLYLSHSLSLFESLSTCYIKPPESRQALTAGGLNGALQRSVASGRHSVVQ